MQKSAHYKLVFCWWSFGSMFLMFVVVRSPSQPARPKLTLCGVFCVFLCRAGHERAEPSVLGSYHWWQHDGPPGSHSARYHTPYLSQLPLHSHHRPRYHSLPAVTNNLGVLLNYLLHFKQFSSFLSPPHSNPSSSPLLDVC